MKVIESHVIYENPLPQLCSRQSFFPFLAELADGTLLAVGAIGQAFESVDSTSYVFYSRDGGKSAFFRDQPRRSVRQSGSSAALI